MSIKLKYDIKYHINAQSVNHIREVFNSLAFTAIKAEITIRENVLLIILKKS